MRSIRLLLCLLSACLLAGAGFAQDWQSAGRAAGSVETAGGAAIEGAQILLEPAQGTGSREATSDDEGRWAVSGLAPGTWRIVVRAQGFQAAEGMLQLPSRNLPLRVALRSFEEVSPGAWEGNALTVKNWLDKGNSLLEQGETELARAEFEKALPVLDEESRPEVLRAIARTHYLEGNRDRAIASLQLALIYGPGESDTRALLEALAKSSGREGELKSFVSRVESEERSDLLAEIGAVESGGPSSSLRAPESEMRPSSKHQMGRFQTRFSERSPLGSRDQILLRHEIDEKVLGKDGARYELEAESFEIYVPPSYSPERGAGLFVLVSPLPWGGFTRESTREALDREGMIWIGANRSGNARLKWDRVSLALDAVHNMSALYALDSDRIFVGGYSGGGRTASALAVLYPEIFRGGLFYMGVDFYRDVPALDRPGAHWPASFPRPASASFELARDRSRYVLLTGELDFNRIQTRELYERYKEDGFANVTLIDLPGASHYSGFGGEALAQGLEALAPVGR